MMKGRGKTVQAILLAGGKGTKVRTHLSGYAVPGDHDRLPEYSHIGGSDPGSLP